MSEPRQVYRLPLANFRVLDMGMTGAAGYAARLLGDLGAEVIGVEHRPSARSAAFRQINRDKLACGLDFETAEGRYLLLRIIARCNVVALDETEQAHLSYTDIKAARPDIIVASVRCSLTGEELEPEDVVAGTAAAAAVCAALIQHRDTGEGQHVVVSSLGFLGKATASLRLPDRQDTLSNAYLHERRFFEPVAHLKGDVEAMPALPWRFSLAPCHVRLPAPEPGQHNRYVFGELAGLSSEEMAEMERRGIILSDFSA